MHRRALLASLAGGAVGSGVGAAAVGTAAAQAACDATLREAYAEVHVDCGRGTHFEVNARFDHDGCEGPIALEVYSHGRLLERAEEPVDDAEYHIAQAFRNSGFPEHGEPLDLVLRNGAGDVLLEETVEVEDYRHVPPEVRLDRASVWPRGPDPGEPVDVDLVVRNTGGRADAVASLVANGDRVATRELTISPHDGCGGDTTQEHELSHAFAEAGVYVLRVVLEDAETGEDLAWFPLGPVVVGDVAAEALGAGVAVSGGLVAGGGLLARRRWDDPE